MTDPDPSTKPESTPPWGEDFDAEKAWILVQNLRADKTSLQTKLGETEVERDSLKTEAQAAADEKKSDADKLADRLTKAEEAAAKATRELNIERVRAKHDLPEDLLDFLTASTAEELEAQAERLAKIGKAAAPAETEEPPKTELPAKPKPSLTPGHGGSDSAPLDPDATVAAIRAAR